MGSVRSRSRYNPPIESVLDTKLPDDVLMDVFRNKGWSGSAEFWRRDLKYLWDVNRVGNRQLEQIMGSVRSRSRYNPPIESVLDTKLPDDVLMDVFRNKGISSHTCSIM